MELSCEASEKTIDVERFEFINNHQGAQNAVLAGGRYDNLSQQMGGKNLPAFGFAGFFGYAL